MTSKKDIIFEAYVAKGYTIKATVEIHAAVTTRMVLQLTEDGVFGFNTDVHNHMALVLNMPRTSFKRYRCQREMTVSVNAKHFQKQLRNIKKKQHLTMIVSTDHPNMLSLKITQEAVGKQASSFEINRITFIEQAPEETDQLLPDDGSYHHPRSMDPNDFSKLKKMTSDNKIIKQIHVKMQGPEYISFFSDEASSYTSEIGCGEIDDDSDVPIYDKLFRASHFNVIIKMSSLTSQHINFYAPKNEKFPLKISSAVGVSGGEMVAYVKDVLCIQYEASKNDEHLADVTERLDRASVSPNPFSIPPSEEIAYDLMEVPKERLVKRKRVPTKKDRIPSKRPIVEPPRALRSKVVMEPPFDATKQKRTTRGKRVLEEPKLAKVVIATVPLKRKRSTKRDENESP